MNINFKSLFKKENLLLFLIILVGSLLRLEGVFTNSFAFTYDVGRDLLAVSEIVNNYKISLIGPTTGLPGVFYGPWWYFLLVPSFLLFSGNPQGVAFAMSVIGILSIILGFVVARRIGGNFLAFAFASFLSVSPVLVSLSSQIWNPNVIPLFLVLILLLIEKLYRKDVKPGFKISFLIGTLLALVIDLEIVFGILLSVGIILSLVLLSRKILNIKSIVSVLLGFLLIFSPRIFFEIRHEFLMTKSLITFLTSGGSSGGLSGLLSIFQSRLTVLFDNFSSSFLGGSNILGVVLIGIIAFALIYYRKKIKDMERNFLLTSFIVLLTFLFGLMFFKHDIWPHYIVGLPIFYLLVFSICLSIIGRNMKNYLLPGIVVLIICLIGLNPISHLQNLNKPLWEGDASVYRNQVAVLDYIYSEANGEDFKYVVYTPPLHDYTYQYLFNWYGPREYGYSPSTDANLAFFVLEPDTEQPLRLTNWLKTREGDGKISKTEKIKGGIIVQTRNN